MTLKIFSQVINSFKLIVGKQWVFYLYINTCVIFTLRKSMAFNVYDYKGPVARKGISNAGYCASCYAYWFEIVLFC